MIPEAASKCRHGTAGGLVDMNAPRQQRPAARALTFPDRNRSKLRGGSGLSCS
jgi:hypothetical protein